MLWVFILEEIMDHRDSDVWLKVEEELDI
jgi:hypothetical protein